MEGKGPGLYCPGVRTAGTSLPFSPPMNAGWFSALVPGRTLLQCCCPLPFFLVCVPPTPPPGGTLL